MKKPLLGTIACPCCKENAMEVRPDKNGHAFGYCVECATQLRIGARNDRRFRENWGLPATNDAQGDPVTVTDTDSHHHQATKRAASCLLDE